MQVKQTAHGDGSFTIRIGRTATTLKTIGEADAFLTGVAVAKVALAKAIAPLIAVEDGDALRAQPAALTAKTKKAR
jgi:hypothetical protein